jgi:methyl-accepting chemotaxis protein
MTKLTPGFETSVKMAAIVGLSLISFAVYGLYCFATVSEVKINGPQYRSIALGNELVADVLPPREFLVETYLTAFEMLDADEDGDELNRLIVKAGRLKRQFLERNRYWDGALAEDTLKRALMGQSVRAGKEFLETLEDGFVPALQAGDRVRAQALLQGPLRKRFREHREGVDAVVRLAQARNRANEAYAARLVHERTVGQVGIGLALVALLAAACFRLVRKCEANLKRLVFGMLTGAVPMSRDIRDKVMWN